MQDRYVGDVGDYGKYALLRAFDQADLVSRDRPLAVVWCMYPDEAHNSDGKHISYLNRSEMRNLDPALFDHLKILVRSGRRSVSEISRSELVTGSNFKFFDRVLKAPIVNGRRPSPSERVAYRESWLQQCLGQTKGCQIVFFDPDNGIATDKMSPKDPRAGKFVFLEELELFAKREQTLIVYHHADRTHTATLVGRMAQRLTNCIPPTSEVLPLIYHRGSCRIFFVIAATAHRDTVRALIQKFLKSGWNAHFDLG